MPPLIYPALMVLGFISGPWCSRIAISPKWRNFLTLYFILAIGAKGGMNLCLHCFSVNEGPLLISTALLIGFFTPFLAYWLLLKTTHLNRVNAAAIAAHYGSVSLVTFATAAAFLDSIDVPYSGMMIALLALMELPAVFSGLYLAGRQNSILHLLRHLFLNKTILALLGSFIAAYLLARFSTIWLIEWALIPFHAIVALFLFDLGIRIYKESGALKKFSYSLILFAFYMPLIGAIIGLIGATIIGLSLGDTTLFIVLAASASYIAVPAIMEKALPEADATLYCPLVLGITFPFNILIGIELYYFIAKLLAR